MKIHNLKMHIRNVICNFNFTVLKHNSINGQLKLISKGKVRDCSTQVKLEELESRYTDIDQELILTTLNTATPEHLSQLNISQTRIKTLKNWQSEQGQFKSLADLLKVQGFCIKILDKICTSIVTRQLHEEIPSKGRRQFVIPPLSKQHTQNFSNAVGLYLGPVGVSWASLTKTNELREWDYFKFAEINKKMLPTDTFTLAQTILKKFPVGDLYVFEAPMYIVAPLDNKQTMVRNEHLELLSMLLALLNTSGKHNLQLTEELAPNCVYYLRSNLSARLFRTLMGTERVSTTPAVNCLLDILPTSLPMPNISLRVLNDVKERYLAQSAINRELLGQALLLIVTFMEICVHKNVESLAAITQRKKKVIINNVN